MRFSRFREQRLEHLKGLVRVVGCGLPPLNSVHGLIDLVVETKPRSVIEIGSHVGISTEVFCLYCQKVVAVDSFDGPWANFVEEFFNRLKDYPNLDFLPGNSPDCLSQFA